MPVQALSYSSVFWHLFPSLSSLWTWQVFHFWDKENIIYYLKMLWSLINIDAKYITSKHLYSFLSWIWNCLFNFAFQHGHWPLPVWDNFQCWMTRGLLGRGSVSVQPFAHHNLGTTILIRAREAAEELLYLRRSLPLSFKSKISPWQRQDKNDRWRSRCVTAPGLSPDPGQWPGPQPTSWIPQAPRLLANWHDS